METAQTPAHRYDLAYLSSLIIALLMAVVSFAGLVADIYPSEELRLAFVPTDAVNLFIGLPILLGSMWSARRGQLIGLLFWPGALFFVLYSYIAYIFAVPVNVVFLLYLLLVMLSGYTMPALLASMDTGAIQQRLRGAVSERLTGGVLAGLGILILLRGMGVIVTALTGQATMPVTELAVTVSDFVIAPAWVIGGVLLWRHQAFGYVVGAGLLFQASMLYIGLIMVLILQPLLTNAAFRGTDVIVVFMMGLFCFIPFALFTRSVMSRGLRQPL